MRSKYNLVAIWAAILLLPVNAFGETEPALQPVTDTTVEQIESCMFGNLPQATSEQSVRMRSIDRAGSEQAISARLWWRHKKPDDTRIMGRIDSPVDIEGAAYLAINDGKELYIYSFIPAIKKVHRISGNSSKGKLWGTDFSYEDISYLQTIVTSGKLSLNGQTTYGEDNLPVWNVTMRPADPNSSYREVVNLIDQKTCVPLHSDLYEKRGQEPSKTLTMDPNSLTQVNGLWVGRRVTMVDHRHQTRTEVEITRIRHDEKISARTFSSNNFYKVR